MNYHPITTFDDLIEVRYHDGVSARLASEKLLQTIHGNCQGEFDDPFVWLEALQCAEIKRSQPVDDPDPTSGLTNPF
jgi:hypothetical protein